MNIIYIHIYMDSDKEDINSNQDDDDIDLYDAVDDDGTTIIEKEDVEIDAEEVEEIKNIDINDTLDLPKPEFISNIDLITEDSDDIKTSTFLSIYEYTAAVSRRASDIEKNGGALVDTTGMKDAKEIAEAEIYQGKFPYKLARYTGHIIRDGKLYNTYDYIDVNKMSGGILK